MNTFFDIVGWIVIVYAIAYTSSKIFFTIISIIQIKVYTKLYPHIATHEELDRFASLNEKR